jgi:hypothetical protein
LQQTQEIDGFLLIPDQEAPALGEPGQRPFHHPPARRIGFLAVGIELFLADAPEMGDVLICRHGLMPSRMIIAFVQAEMLRPRLSRLGALHHDGL